MGGLHHGYLLPHEKTNNIGYASSFPSLADYEIYRNKIQNTPRCLEAFKYANDTKCIISYERNFLNQSSKELLTRQNCFTNYVFLQEYNL
jgi:hypothetical protein